MKHKIGACIFNKNEIISTGFNRWLHKGSSKYLPPCHFSIHAEEDALFGLSRRQTYGSSIFVYRSNNRLAKPCSNCQKAIDRAGIQHVLYSPV